MMLKLTRPIASIDLETTGPFVGVDRIVDIAIVTLHPDGRVEEWQTLVNPGIPIPPSATAIHGITDEMVADAPLLLQVSNEIRKRLACVDLSGFNAKRFDVPFLKAEMAQIGKDLIFDNDVVVVDAMAIYHHFHKRDLAAAVAQYLNEELPNAHRAMPDARAALNVLIRQSMAHKRDGMPLTPASIVEFLRDKDAIDEDGKFKWYGDEVRVTFGKYRGRTLAWVAKHEPGFLHWMLKGEFSQDTKQVARDALAGVMPKRETK